MSGDHPEALLMPSTLVKLADDLELDWRAYELRRSGRPVRLSRIPMELLFLLVERRGELVTRDEIVARVWGKSVFLDTANGINGAVRKLRQVLDDDPEHPRYLQTVTGMGYRFIAPVAEVSPSPIAPVLASGRVWGTANLVGRKVSHYRILQVLGGGGMGIVYKAEDIKLGRKVAIKFLPAELASDSSAFERLEREARAASALEHSNICPVYELGEHEGQPFIVMQMLEGKTLQERIEAAGQQLRPLPTNEIIDLALQIVAGLEAAHEKGIIHRDIKPANIFVTDRGEVKILDFGLAKIVEADLAYSRVQREDELMQTSESGASSAAFSTLRGTAFYMSPEQVRGEKLDGRTDLFSFGLVLYEMATGQRAFPGNTAAIIYDAIPYRHPPPLQQFNSGSSTGLEPIITKALEKNRNSRYQSASDVRTDLRRLQGATDLRAPPAGAFAASHVGIGDWGRLDQAKFSAKLGGTIAAAVVLSLLVVGNLYYRSDQHKRLTERDTVVLADFANSTGDAVFDDTLKTALNISLRQSPFLNSLSDGEVAETLQQMTRPANTKLTPDVALELCLRAGSKAYLAGSIGSLGSEYVLGLKAVNCQSGDTLAQEQVTAASKEMVLGALGQASSKLRTELGESLATVKKFDIPLEQATTSSLEALKSYSLGMEAFNEKGIAAALPHHLRAIELDPNFALGYWALGDDYGSLGEVGRASEYFERAFQLREHASEREELTITANYYLNVTGELDKAAQAYQEEVERYPRDSTAYSHLGVALANQGQYDKAAEVTRQAIRLAPDELGGYLNLANYALATEHLDEAGRIIRDAQDRKIDDLLLHNNVYALAFLGANSAAMAEQQKWFASKPEYESFGLALASDTEAYGGHVGKARNLARQAVDSAIRADSKESGAMWQANTALQQAAYGFTVEARQASAAALKLAPASQGVEAEAALAFAMAGDPTRAEFLARDLDKRFPLDMQIRLLWLPAIHGQSALDKSSPASAVTALQSGSGIELGAISFVINNSCLYHVYVRGEAYLAAGQGTAAAAQFQKILDHGGIVWNCWTGALAHLGTARANALQSRTSRGADSDVARLRALAAYKDFLVLWKDADPDIPVLKQAKAEYVKLQ
jgi:eukaryotic-like serine/threonine-protein kinase